MCNSYLIILRVLSFLEPSKSDINVEEGQHLLMEEEEVMLKVKQLETFTLRKKVVAGGNFLSKAALQDEVEIFELDGG